MQGLSRPFVELACNCAEFGLAEGRYISAFGEVLPQQAVGVFIAPALPSSRNAVSLSIRIGQARVSVHFRSSLSNAFAITTSFRMTAV
ncbi:MAG: hypothetical protein ACI8Q6_004027, partial [Granulosicoccus sp.]